MAWQPRRTSVRLKMARFLLDTSPRVVWGFDMGRTLGISTGSVYPFLVDLAMRGYLTTEIDAVAYPPRRCHALTDKGRVFLEGFVR